MIGAFKIGTDQSQQIIEARAGLLFSLVKRDDDAHSPPNHPFNHQLDGKLSLIVCVTGGKLNRTSWPRVLLLKLSHEMASAMAVRVSGFLGGRVQLAQEERGHRVGLDAALLAAAG